MPQVFSKRAVLAVKLIWLGAAFVLAAAWAIYSWRDSPPISAGEALLQPIPFSHKHHAGDDGIDCRYCHVSVETSRFAGMPSTEICLTCHSQLLRDASVLAQLHQSARSGTRIAWNRVYDLPDFVFFDHSIHVAKGVACAQCHGAIDEMPLTRRHQALQMQWCLDCHRNPAARIATFRSRASGRAIEAAQVRRTIHFQSEQRLTDCSTCHR